MTTPASGATGPGGELPIDALLQQQMPALLEFLRHHTGEELAARETVEDLAQSVCREILQDSPSLRFENADKFRAYLFLQAVRKVVDRARFHRMAKRDMRREEQLPETRAAAEAGVYGSLATASQMAIARERLDLFEKALQLLPDAQREAVLLSRVGGLSYEAIARQKGVTESTIRALAARGLVRLSLELQRRA